MTIINRWPIPYANILPQGSLSMWWGSNVTGVHRSDFTALRITADSIPLEIELTVYGGINYAFSNIPN